MVTFNYFTSDKASTKFQGKIGFVNIFLTIDYFFIVLGHNADLEDVGELIPYVLVDDGCRPDP